MDRPGFWLLLAMFVGGLLLSRWLSSIISPDYAKLLAAQRG